MTSIAGRIFRGGGRAPITVERRERAAFGLAGTERAGAESVTLLLPIPPSANGLFANSAAGGRHRAEAYDAWIKEAGWTLQAQRPGRVSGPYSILIEVERGDGRRRRDLGNFEKACSDLLVRHHVVQDDSLAEEIVLRWGEVEGVRVTVTRWVGALA